MLRRQNGDRENGRDSNVRFRLLKPLKRKGDRVVRDMKGPCKPYILQKYCRNGKWGTWKLERGEEPVLHESRAGGVGG